MARTFRRGRTTFKISEAGMRAVCGSGAMQAELLKAAQGVAARAERLAGVEGAEYTADVRAGRYRAVAMAKPANAKAGRDCRANDTLLKARA